jgi:lysozyme
VTAIDLALPLIREAEGLRLKAYLCPANKWTIGYGHTKGVRPGMVITRKQAEDYLLEDAAEALACVRKHVRASLTPHQEAALVGFVFNFGEAKFKTSTFLTLINQGRLAEVPAQLKRWVKAQTDADPELEVLPGLVKRRAAEVVLWETPVEAPGSPVESLPASRPATPLETPQASPEAPPGPWMALLEVILRWLVGALQTAAKKG